MSFRSQSTDPIRRFRANQRSGLFRETSPEVDMFFHTTPSSTFTFPRSNLADRLDSMIFDEFPCHRTMRSFSGEQPDFGSFPRHRHRPSWASDAADTCSSPEASRRSEERDGPSLRRSAFQRSDSIPVRVTHESRQGSRASTPESTGSAHSHSSGQYRPQSTGGGASETNVMDGSCNDDRGPLPDDMDQHRGVSRNGRQSYTARRQPKVHHIPIHVEPRDGQSTVVVTDSAPGTPVTADAHVSTPSPPVVPPRQRTVKKIAVNNYATRPVPPAAADKNVNGLAATDSSARCTPTEQEQPLEATVVEERNGPIPMPEPTSHPLAAAAATSEAKPAEPQRQEAPKKSSAMLTLEHVHAEADKLRDVVSQFSGVRGDKQYLYLDEMLTRLLIKLDNINTEGNEELRRARREAVMSVSGCIQLLEAKVTQKIPESVEEEKMEVTPVTGPSEVENEVCDTNGEGIRGSEVQQEPGQEARVDGVPEDEAVVDQKAVQHEEEMKDIESGKQEVNVTAPEEVQDVSMDAASKSDDSGIVSMEESHKEAESAVTSTSDINQDAVLDSPAEGTEV